MYRNDIDDIKELAPEGIDEGQKENLSLWDIANLEAGTDIRIEDIEEASKSF